MNFRPLLIAVLVVLGLVAAGVLWSASELHYVGCVKAAEARTPVALNLYGGWRDTSGTDSRASAVAGCSHLP